MLSRFLITLFIILSTVLVAKTQYVSIPDTNFRNALKESLPTSACINGNLLDTVCSENLSITYYWNSKNITDLTGIQYFKNMTGLIINDNNLASIPPLANSIASLYCYNNQLTILPVLPTSLRTLSCSNNRLTTIPELPDTIVTLKCSQNLLTSLPSLPNTISSLQCEQNQIASLPALTKELRFINCSQNQLAEIPALPNVLITLYCSQNQLTSLPDFPSALNYLICSENKLTSLPLLSSTFKKLWCNTNQLTFKDIVPNIFVPDFIYAPQDSVDKSINSTFTSGDNIQLSTSATYTGNQYQWMKDGKNIQDSTNRLGSNTSTLILNNATPADSGSYSCAITNPAAPLLTLNRRNITLKFKVKENLPEITVYELITPNDDNDNDFFTVLNSEKYKNIEVVISNTWGSIVFHKQKYQNDWSGNELTDGTYYYVVTVHDTQKTYKGKLIIKR